MLTKSNLTGIGAPSLFAFIILYCICDKYVPPVVFSVTDSGNFSLPICPAVDATMLLSTFYGTRWLLVKLDSIER